MICDTLETRQLITLGADGILVRVPIITSRAKRPDPLIWIRGSVSCF